MCDYDKMTQGEFDSLLEEVINEDLVGRQDTVVAERLLSIPGIYEVLSEHFNNTVLELWKSRQDEEEMDEDELRQSRQPEVPDGRVLVEKGKQ